MLQMRYLNVTATIYRRRNHYGRHFLDKEYDDGTRRPALEQQRRLCFSVHQRPRLVDHRSADSHFAAQNGGYAHHLAGCGGTPTPFCLGARTQVPGTHKGQLDVAAPDTDALVQIVALPAVILAYVFMPTYVPAVLAAVVGAHLLPYAWLQKSNLYIVLGLMISLVPYLMAMILRETAFNYIGFVVGGIAMVFAFLLKASVEKQQQKSIVKSFSPFCQ